MVGSFPLISCIMPTRNRRAFLGQAIKLFYRQDYPNKELVTIEDGPGCNSDVMLGTNYHHLGGGNHSIGYKRNIACHTIARGDIICLWDDDDYFSPQRLSKQVAPLLSGEADVTACKMDLLLDLNENCLYRCSDEAHDAFFKHGVRSNTLMFKASYWRDGLHYEDSSSGEDTQYLLKLMEHGARLKQIVDPTAFISVRHGTNISTGLDCADWGRVPMEQYIGEEDRAFYEGLKAGIL